MNILFISVFFTAFGYYQSVPSDTVSEKMIIPVNYSFNSVTVYSDVIVYITEGDKNEIIVKNEDVAKAIKFKVDEGVLVIHGKKGFFSNRKNPERIIITVKDIRGITIMDDAEVRSIGELSDKNLKLEIYGDGAIYVNTRALEVSTFIKGLGKIEVNGNFKTTSVNKDAYGNMITTYK
jgi:hypothetical protein